MQTKTRFEDDKNQQYIFGKGRRSNVSKFKTHSGFHSHQLDFNADVPRIFVGTFVPLPLVRHFLSNCSFTLSFVVVLLVPVALSLAIIPFKKWCMLGPFAVMNLFITGTVPVDLKVYDILNRLCLHVLARAMRILNIRSYGYIVYYYNMLFLGHLELSPVVMFLFFGWTGVYKLPWEK